MRAREGARPNRPGPGDGTGRRRARSARRSDLRRRGGAELIAHLPNGGVRVGITGIGACLPERVVTNEDLAQVVETSDEWIRERTGIRERRVVEPDQAASDIAVPAAREALERAGIAPGEVDLVIVATATPDMFFPATASLVGEELGAFDAAAYDLSAGCTGFVYGLAQAYGSIAAGLALRVLVVGTETLSKVVNWQDRTTCILFGDGAAAALVEPVVDGGFVGFELGSDGSRAPDLCLPAGGSRAPASAQTIEHELHFLRMNGPEVFRLATRVMVSSGEKLLDECGLGVEDVDLYAPHQANRRIIDHAVRALRLPSEKVLVNVDRFGNTSSASIPLCLHEALASGRLEAGMTVLMTAVGAGLTWGSSLVVWGNGR